MPSRPYTALDTATARPEPAAEPGGAPALRPLARLDVMVEPAFTASAAEAERSAGARRRLFSPLTRLIILINIAGLVLFFLGVLALSNFRAGLADARIQALKVEGDIIAGALAESALVAPDAEGQSFRFDKAAAAPVLRRLSSISGSRLRLYDERGRLILDSRDLMSADQVQTYRLPPIGGLFGTWPALDRLYDWIIGRLPRVDLPRYEEVPGADARLYPEVTSALLGEKDDAVRANQVGRVVVSVAVPVQRLRLVQGALLLSTEGGEIEAMLRAERLQIAQMFIVAAAVSALLSLLVSRIIGRPIRDLARAASEARSRRKGRVRIPTFAGRRDEIGDLARALSHMTDGLYTRLDAIERFAADVAHEIKNPLTSLRSAVETLHRTTDAPRRDKLLAIIQDDVRRIDRLITDISGASRLDAELAREQMAPVDLARLLKSLASVALEAETEPKSPIIVVADAGALDEGAFLVPGLEDRLAQVFRNLLDNALSFSPPGAPVRIRARLDGTEVRVVIEDEGPGIPPESLERIFERFYTARDEAPAGRDKFGEHSGLGLAIARQIIEVHGGRIWAENRGGGAQTGARFTVVLPR